MAENKSIQAIAVIMTVFNRREKTINCLNSLQNAWLFNHRNVRLEVFLTDDGCTDGTADAIRSHAYEFPCHILQGTGTMYWLGGMNNAWREAIKQGGFDGYLWLNDDTTLLPAIFEEIQTAEDYVLATKQRKGIYVGSTNDPATGQFTYGGFDFVNKWTLKDRFVIPDGVHVRWCECAHGNITYVSHEVVEQMGVFCDGYIHGAGDHDYTYQAHQAGYPVAVMRKYVGQCENDHIGKGRRLENMSLKERIAYMKSPFGLNLHNNIAFFKT